MKRTLEHHMIVRQEHLNQFGSLFGGRVLSVIDELAFVVCSRAFPGRNFVTRAVDGAEFKAAAVLGDLLEFKFGIERIGRTSATVRIKMRVFGKGHGARGELSFDGKVVMVCVDECGRPMPIIER